MHRKSNNRQNNNSLHSITKRLLIAICVFAVALVSVLSPAYALENDICDEVDSSTIPNYNIICGGGDEQDSFMYTSNILNTVFLWAGVLAVVAIIIGGYLYMTSQGAPEKTKRAKDTLMYSVIGLTVVLLAFSITNFILRVVGGGDAESGGAVVVAESISISAPTTSAYVGEKITLEVIFTPSNTANKNVSWSSSNAAVASVSANGVVKGKKAGTTTITVTSRNGKTASKTITILDK